MNKEYKLVKVEPDIITTFLACVSFTFVVMFIFSKYIPSPNLLEALGMLFITLILIYIFYKIFILIFSKYELKVIYVDKKGNEF